MFNYSAETEIQTLILLFHSEFYVLLNRYLDMNNYNIKAVKMSNVLILKFIKLKKYV